MAQRTINFKNLLLIGQVVTSNAPDLLISPHIPKATKVQVRIQEFNSFLKMYFGNNIDLYTHDPDKICEDGDIVLLRKREEKLSKFITHDLVKVLYKYGDVTDPISGEKCVGPILRKTAAFEKELYGVAEDGSGGFDYDSAPPRGWQLGRKDFTDKVPYKKFQDYEKGHPLYDDPMAV